MTVLITYSRGFSSGKSCGFYFVLFLKTSVNQQVPYATTQFTHLTRQ